MKNIELFKVFMSEDAPKEVKKILMSGFIGQGDGIGALAIVQLEEKR